MIDKKLNFKKRILDLKVSKIEKEINSISNTISLYRRDSVTRASNKRYSSAELSRFKENIGDLEQKIDSLETKLLILLNDKVYKDFKQSQEEAYQLAKIKALKPEVLKLIHLLFRVIERRTILKSLGTNLNYFMMSEKVIDRTQKIEKSLDVLENFNPVEGGETTLYYLRLLFRGVRYYKIGVTLKSVNERYSPKDFQFIDKVLYEKKLTHANTIEQKIKTKYRSNIFPLAILSSGHSEVFDRDILDLDD